MSETNTPSPVENHNLKWVVTSGYIHLTMPKHATREDFHAIRQYLSIMESCCEQRNARLSPTPANPVTETEV